MRDRLMTSRHNPLPPPFVGWTPSSLWETAIRLRCDVEQALVRLVTELVPLSEQFGSGIVLYVEPTGDACDTGHWLEIEVDGPVAWAEITPWPFRHDGRLPPYIQDELLSVGWVPVMQEPDPLAEMPWQVSEDPVPVDEAPLLRLAIAMADEDVAEWAAAVVDAVRLVVVPPDDRWFVHALCVRSESDEPTPGPFGPLPPEGHWNVDLAQLLGTNDAERAVWPAGTEGAALCCGLGLHHLHEPPCQPITN